MTSISRFEDLRAWQHARVLCARVHAVTREVRLRAERALSDQLRRAAISVMANIAEGFNRGGRREFHQFLSIAKGSLAELMSHLYAAADAGYLTDAEARELQELALETMRTVAGLRSAVARGRKTRG